MQDDVKGPDAVADNDNVQIKKEKLEGEEKKRGGRKAKKD